MIKIQKKKRKAIVILASFLVAIGNFQYSYSEDFQGKYATGEILVTTKTGQIEELNRLNTKYNLTKVEFINGYTYELTLGKVNGNIEAVAKKYNQNKDVSLVEPNYTLHAVTIPNDPLFTYQWGLHNTGQTINNTAGKNNIDVNAPEAWDIAQGNEAVKIAVLDSGVDYNHEDLNGRVITGYDFVNNDSDAMDDNGHGTMIAGVIGASSNNSKGIAGIDWRARIMPIKILDEDGTGTVSDLMKGINYAVSNGAKVVNMSLVGTYSETLDATVRDAYAQGVVLVSAAGNDNTDLNNNKRSPISNDGDSNWIIGVGSIGQSGNTSSFSSYGSKYIDVMAPGENILTSHNATSSSYVYASGTSISAGFVSGLVGVVAGNYSSVGIGTLKNKIISKATNLNLGDSYGKGNINAYTSLKSSVKKIGVMKADGQSDYNFYVYNTPADMSSQNLTGSDLWNIPAGNNTVATTGVDIDGDGNRELAVLKNDNGDHNLYVYNSPNGSSPQLIRAMDLWNIPSGDNVVAIAGVDYDGNGREELAILKNESGDQNVYIYFAPTTTEATFLIGGDLWNIPSGDNVIAMTGLDIDGDLKDEIAVLKNENGDHNLYIYQSPNGMEAATLVGTDKWEIPSGDNAVDITGIDIDDDGVDELGVMKNENGDHNFYVYKSPVGTNAMPLLAGDKWNIPSGNNTIGIATVE